MLLRVINIQRGCVYDGPGVRTTVFLKGCSLHCPWCCNPETISYEEQWFIDDRKCVLRQGRSSQLCAPCERQDGTRSIQSCPYGVVEPTSYDYSTEELLEILLKDKELYKESHGGVTFSGGEPLLQSEELVTILSKLKGLNVHIVLETTLVASEKAINLVLPYVDLYIIDLKLQPQMKLSDRSYLGSIKNKLSLMRDKQKCFRLVFVDEVFDYIEGDQTIFEKGPLTQLAAEGELMSYTHRGFWQCMDNIREKNLLEQLLIDGVAPWKKWEREIPIIK